MKRKRPSHRHKKIPVEQLVEEEEEEVVEKQEIVEVNIPQEEEQQVSEETPSLNPILSRLHQQLHPLSHHDNELPVLLQEPCSTLFSFMHHSLSKHSNDSIMIIGPGKSGKKHVVKHTLNKLAKDGKHVFHTVHVNGLHISTDVQLMAAVMESMEKILDDGDKKTPTRNFDEDSFNEESDTVEFLDTLRKFSKQSVVFVLDNFENMCKCAGKMLYTITDTIHESYLSVIIIGLTTSSSIALSMDRRVRSRFSSRKLYTLLPRNAAQVSQIVQHYLEIHSTDTDESIDEYNRQLKNCLIDPDVVQSFEECVIHSNCNFIFNFAFKVFELCQPSLETYPMPENHIIFTPQLFVKAFMSLLNNRANPR